MNQRNNDKNKLRKLAVEWVLNAQDDEMSAQGILKNKEGAPSTVCFLSQQMAEKYLKAFLVFHNKDFPKIHDLDRLLRLCEDINFDFKKLKQEATYLSDFYINTRYPADGRVSYIWKDAKDAFRAAFAIKEFVINRIELNQKV